MLKLKVPKMQEWPTSTAPAIPPSARKSALGMPSKYVNSGKKTDNGVDSRPLKQGKPHWHDKQK